MRDLIEKVVVDGIAHTLYKCAVPGCEIIVGCDRYRKHTVCSHCAAERRREAERARQRARASGTLGAQ